MASRPDLLMEMKGKRGKIIGNRLSRRERLVLAATQGPKCMLTALFDFSVSGGAVGSYLMTDEQGRPVSVPANAIITSLMTDVITSFTSSGSATVAISADNTSLLAATAYNDAALTGVDAQSISPTKITSEKQLTVAIATAAVTAGKMRVFVEYVQSEA